MDKPHESDAVHDAVGIRVRNLTLRFGNSPPVLRDLSLSIKAGEIVALVGASGCGKSTLLKAIASLLPHTSGEVEFSIQSSRSSDIAYVFQDATLLPWRTVAENVRLPFELGPWTSERRAETKTSKPNRGERRQKILDAITAVGLDQTALKKFPRELSGGMRMRTSLARAIVMDPSVLLLDEPFAALDDILRTRMNDLVLELHRLRPRTILFVTHNIAEAVFLSHRIVVLGNAQIADSFDNPLPWPRESGMRSTVEFAQVYGRVGAALAKVAA